MTRKAIQDRVCVFNYTTIGTDFRGHGIHAFEVIELKEMLFMTA